MRNLEKITLFTCVLSVLWVWDATHWVVANFFPYTHERGCHESRAFHTEDISAAAVGVSSRLTFYAIRDRERLHKDSTAHTSASADFAEVLKTLMFTGYLWRARGGSNSRPCAPEAHALSI